MTEKTRRRRLNLPAPDPKYIMTTQEQLDKFFAEIGFVPDKDV